MNCVELLLKCVWNYSRVLLSVEDMVPAQTLALCILYHDHIIAITNAFIIDSLQRYALT